MLCLRRFWNISAWNNSWSWSLSGTISCVTDMIRFLPVTMTCRFLNFNSITYTEDRHESSDRHELQIAGTRCPALAKSSVKWSVSSQPLPPLLLSSPCNIRRACLGSTIPVQPCKQLYYFQSFTSMILNSECFGIFFIRIFEVKEYYDVMIHKNHLWIGHGL